MKPIISFVILHYKDIKSTDSCVRSILKMDEQEYIRIVIVDNDIQATEEERGMLVDQYKEYSAITILPVRENGGFSHGNNLGYRFAREKLKASFIVVTNNDIVFLQNNFVDLIRESFETSKSYVIGPNVICQRSGRHQNPMAEKVRTAKEAERTAYLNRKGLKYFSLLYPFLYWKIKRQEIKDFRYRKERREVYTVTQINKVLFGACLIFTPSFIKMEDKAFWPETKFYYEEYILAWRCLNNGYEMKYEPSICVMHESGAATRIGYHSAKKRIRFQMERIVEASEVYSRFVRENRTK